MPSADDACRGLLEEARALEQMPKVYEGDHPYIFVSYAHADRDAVLPIIRALVDGGYRVWYDDGIRAATDFPNYIADRLHDCACFLMLVSRSYLASAWCKNEANYAFKHSKATLSIHLEEVELTGGLELVFGAVRPLFWHKYDSDDEFNKALFAVLMLDPCLTEEGEISRGVKPRDDEASGAGTVADRESGVDEDNPVEPSHPAEEDDHEQGGKSRRRFLKIVGMLAGVLMIVMAGLLIGSFVAANSDSRVWSQDDTDVTSPGLIEVILESDTDGYVSGVPVRLKLDDYKWDELKALSQQIAEARNNDDWMEIAKNYHLVDEDGRLRGNEKVFTLNDGTKTSIRILGFRHDELADGGRAGITFEFADAPVMYCMHEEPTNEGGWEKSNMRKWLNSEFLSSLPSELQSRIETVKKKTNNVGLVESEDDISVVAHTDDRLWLPSVSEVYGHADGAWSSATYDAEGVQYRLYADQGVTAGTYDFCKKDGTDSWWWLRSPHTIDTNGFHVVSDGGDWLYVGADFVWGVSPGFCF